jgi:hypothetical protein
MQMSADKELPVVAWMTKESKRRLARGGNSKGSVPVHRQQSVTAMLPLADHARASARIAELEQQLEQARKALSDIAAIEDKMFGGDWDEIEQARAIARADIASQGSAQEVGK